MKHQTVAVLAVSTMILSCLEQSAWAVAPLPQDQAPASAPAQAQPVSDSETQSKEQQRLITAFTNLWPVFQQQSGILDSDRIVLERLRSELEMYNLRWPDDQRMLALQLQCCRWLADRDCVDQIFAQLVELNPDTPAMVVTWAEDLRGRNEFERALEVINSAKQPSESVPVLQYLKVKTLFSLNRFEEAAAALELIPESAQIKPTAQLDLVKLRTAVPQYVEFWSNEQQLRNQQTNNPIVVLETERGTIKLELYEDEAPISVKNFISLVESGFYNDTLFHRVEVNHVTQGGDPNTKPGATGVPGTGGPGYTIADEFAIPNARKHFQGSLGMAHGSNANSGGSQFYICHEPKPDLNGGYTVFGHVIEGLDVALQMKRDQKLIKATVERKREGVNYADFPKITTASQPVLVPSAPPPGAPATPGQQPQPAPADEPAADEPAAEEPAPSE